MYYITGNRDWQISLCINLLNLSDTKASYAILLNYTK